MYIYAFKFYNTQNIKRSKKIAIAVLNQNTFLMSMYSYVCGFTFVTCHFRQYWKFIRREKYCILFQIDTYEITVKKQNFYLHGLLNSLGNHHNDICFIGRLPKCVYLLSITRKPLLKITISFHRYIIINCLLIEIRNTQ